jgi:Flp pilus assembly protein TadD
MADQLVADTVPVAAIIPEDLERAARAFEQALKIGRPDPQVAYMLGLCYKRLRRTADARNAFRKIENPDANVELQLGWLSFEEQQYAQAETEFARAWEMDPACYAAGYNLFLARLALGNLGSCAALLPRLAPHAPSAEEQRFLALLEPLFQHCQTAQRDGPPPLPRAGVNGEFTNDSVIPQMTSADEQRLLQILRGLGQFDAALPILRTLAAARPHSGPIQEAHLEAVLIQANEHVDRCQWTAAEQLLLPLARRPVDAPSDNRATARSLQTTLLNLLGCCECMLQEFNRASNYFTMALKLAGNDPWVHQNAALTYELAGRLDLADTHWNRYFDLLDRRVPVPSIPKYLEALAYEGLNRLADNYSRKEQWQSALNYLQRAHRLRPQDAETLERLFHLYTQLRRPEDARRALRRLREMRPQDPQFELYELDVRDVKSLEDIDRLLSDIRKTLSKFPNDLRVEERAVNTVGNIIPLMGRMCDQLTDQLNKIVDQMRSLPNYQINWSAVREVMRDLEYEFQRLRRITQKCLTLVTLDEHRRIVRDLADHIDRKMEICHSMGA